MDPAGGLPPADSAPLQLTSPPQVAAALEALHTAKGVPTPEDGCNLLTVCDYDLVTIPLEVFHEAVVRAAETLKQNHQRQQDAAKHFAALSAQAASGLPPPAWMQQPALDGQHHLANGQAAHDHLLLQQQQQQQHMQPRRRLKKKKKRRGQAEDDGMMPPEALALPFDVLAIVAQGRWSKQLEEVLEEKQLTLPWPVLKRLKKKPGRPSNVYLRQLELSRQQAGVVEEDEYEEEEEEGEEEDEGAMQHQAQQEPQQQGLDQQQQQGQQQYG